MSMKTFEMRRDSKKRCCGPSSMPVRLHVNCVMRSRKPCLSECLPLSI